MGEKEEKKNGGENIIKENDIYPPPGGAFLKSGVCFFSTIFKS